MGKKSGLPRRTRAKAGEAKVAQSTSTTGDSAVTSAVKLAGQVTADSHADSQVPKSEEWAVPAGVLNAFWTDILPRIVGAYWRAKLFSKWDLTMKDWDEVRFEGATRRSPKTLRAPKTSFKLQGEWKGSKAFKKRLHQVNQYLRNKKGRIKISVIGEGGFDYLLSDLGLELFIPPMPMNDLALLRYFTFRRTGRRAIGIPSYIRPDGFDPDFPQASAMSTDSPTGPGMLLVSISQVQNHFRLSDDDPIIQELRRRESPQRDGLAKVSFDKYQAMLFKERVWFVTGSVCRGILTELPRVVAELWMEEVSKATKLDGAYTKYFNFRTSEKPKLIGDDDTCGIRQIFRERLETSLPTDQEMRFRIYDPKNACDDELDAADQGATSRWVAGDVMITNRGFFFPKVGPAPKAANVYADIRAGLSGNPVFTDSIPCE